VLPPPLPHQLEVLGRVHDRVTVAAADGGPPPVVIFGLDGVLFDTRPRTLRILREYADDVAFDYPDVAEGLRSLDLSQVHSLLSNTLREGGVTKADFVRDVTNFWHERYYADDYVVHDEPNAGAADYVRTLRDVGCCVAYLSRRDVPGMLLGTVAALRDHAFPVASPGVQLALKPDATLSDDAFGRQAIPQFAQTGDVLAFFGCEVSSAELARASFPGADIALVEISGAAQQATEELPVLRDFRSS
jgi:beta-phosphoglucomutase-like phosphatase (HAD superfamily)